MPIIVVALLTALIVLSGSHRAFIVGILIFVVALLTSVMLHELGHFLTAKKFGMQVDPVLPGLRHDLWSFFRGETEYGVKALPLGGFVKIAGMTRMEEIDVVDEPRSFRRQPGWQRIIVLAAGSLHALRARAGAAVHPRHRDRDGPELKSDKRAH